MGKFSKVNAKRKEVASRISAFGESKSVEEWEHDSRCKVSAELLRYRLNTGKYTAEEAMTKPPRQYKHNHNGNRSAHNEAFMRRKYAGLHRGRIEGSPL